ncbi:MAG: hypothetical protein IKS96_01780 [Fibrobacter sp.]|nr:hypothetical protein [Fibrobacter sp.]
MPIEFTQTARPQGSTDKELYKLEMKYDGSGRRISKSFLTKSATAANWDTVKVTHYTGIGTEVREEFHVKVEEGTLDLFDNLFLC